MVQKFDSIQFQGHPSHFVPKRFTQLAICWLTNTKKIVWWFSTLKSEFIYLLCKVVRLHKDPFYSSSPNDQIAKYLTSLKL